MFVCKIITKSCPESVFEAKVSGNSLSAPALQEHLAEHQCMRAGSVAVCCYLEKL